MSSQDKFKKFTDTIKEKTKEYAPIIKEKSMSAFEKTKEFTNEVVIPSLKKSYEITKQKMQDYQEQHKKAETGNGGTTESTTTTVTEKKTRTEDKE